MYFSHFVKALSSHLFQSASHRNQPRGRTSALQLQGLPCHLDGKCRSTKSVVYKASVVDENKNSETYTGLTKNTFKERYYGHRASFINRDNEQRTAVIEKAPKFNPTTRKCTLCLKEKYHIIFQPSGSTLIIRSELYSKCRHMLSKLLVNTRMWVKFH